MKPSQYEIILNYLQGGIEISAEYKKTERLNQNIEILGFINCIRKEGIYYCLIREIRGDNQSDYFEERFYDKEEELVFETIEDLTDYIESETNLSLSSFRKAKNDIYYR